MRRRVLRHERRPLVDGLRAQSHPQEVLDHVGFDERAVDVEDGEHVVPALAPLDRRAHRARLGFDGGAAGRLLAFALHGLRPRHTDDSREVHVLEVVLPVIQRSVKGEDRALGRGNLFPHRHQVAGVEDAVDLGVNAIELDQVQPAVESLALSIQVVGQVGHAGAERQPFDHPLRSLDKTQRGPRARGKLFAGRVGPVRRADRLTVLVAQRMLGEVTRR